MISLMLLRVGSKANILQKANSRSVGAFASHSGKGWGITDDANFFASLVASKQEVQEKTLLEVFNDLDANNDGLLQPKEIINGFSSIGIILTDKVVDDILKQADEN